MRIAPSFVCLFILTLPPRALADEPQAERDFWILGKVEYTTTYYYRGFFQEDDGLILQPAFKLGYDLFRAPPSPLGRGWPSAARSGEGYSTSPLGTVRG